MLGSNLIKLLLLFLISSSCIVILQEIIMQITLEFVVFSGIRCGDYPPTRYAEQKTLTTFGDYSGTARNFLI